MHLLCVHPSEFVWTQRFTIAIRKIIARLAMGVAFHAFSGMVLLKSREDEGFRQSQLFFFFYSSPDSSHTL